MDGLDAALNAAIPGTRFEPVLAEQADALRQEIAADASKPAASESGHVLIAYFSLGRNAEYPEGTDASTSASLVLDDAEMVGTTEYVARLIQNMVGGDLYSIETVAPYPTDFDRVVDQNHEEMNAAGDDGRHGKGAGTQAG